MDRGARDGRKPVTTARRGERGAASVRWRQLRLQTAKRGRARSNMKARGEVSFPSAEGCLSC